MTKADTSPDLSSSDIKIVEGAANSLLLPMAQLHDKAFKRLGQQGWDAAQISASLKQSGCHLAYTMVSDKIAGFALYKTVLDEAELFTLGVDPVYQRAGIASKLLTAIANQLRKERVMSFFLEVRRDNTTAIACYEKLGFERIAVRQNYYTDGAANKIDACIYRLSL